MILRRRELYHYQVRRAPSGKSYIHPVDTEQEIFRARKKKSLALHRTWISWEI